MAPSISGPFAEALAADRERYNSRFVHARHALRSLDPEAFAQHLVVAVQPIVSRVAEIAADAVEPVSRALYDASLVLMGRDAMGPGSRPPDVTPLWSHTLAALSQHLAREPEPIVTAVSNALLNLKSLGEEGCRSWVTGLLRAAPRCIGAEQLRAAGMVAGWTAGLAQYRAGALRVAGELEPELAALTLGLSRAVTPIEVKKVLAKLEVDPWLTPDDALERAAAPRKLEVVKSLGGFRGFGGAFINPPTVACEDGRLLAVDRDHTWVLDADALGATLHRVGPARQLRDRSPAGFAIDNGGTVERSGQSRRVAQLAGCSSQASSGHTLAVTLPHSHSIFLIAPVLGR